MSAVRYTYAGTAGETYAVEGLDGATTVSRMGRGPWCARFDVGLNFFADPDVSRSIASQHLSTCRGPVDLTAALLYIRLALAERHRL